MNGESNKFGTLTAIEYLLNLDGISASESITSLRSASSGHFQSMSIFLSTLNLLEKMSYVDVSEGKAKKKKNFDKSTFLLNFIIYLNQVHILSKFFSPTILRLDSVKNQYYLFANSISLDFGSFRNLLIESQFFIYDSTRLKLYINSEFKDLTEGLIFSLVENERKKRGMSPEKLKKQLANQEQFGLEAELFVLEYESKRLSAHSRVKDIQHVSLFDVTAGFDILSFSTNQSYILDREIEVKSYAGQPHFYLSRNEYDRAKENKNGYFLYLVDREKIDNSDYCPEIIGNLFESLEDTDKWSSTIECYHYIANATTAK